MAEGDRHKGRLDEKRVQFLLDSTRILIEQLSVESLQTAEDGTKIPNSEEKIERPETTEASDLEASVVCIPAHDEADELAARMLGELLHKKGVSARVLSCTALAGECLEHVKNGQAKIACVTVIPPFGYMHARYMCRKLHDQFPDLKVVAAVLTEKDVEEVRQRRPKLQADELAASLQQAMTAVLSFMPETKKEEEPLAVAS